MVNFSPIKTADLIEAVSGKVVFEKGQCASVSQLGEPLEVGPDGVAFVIAEGYLRDVAETTAGVLVIQEAFAERVVSSLPPSVKLCIAAKDAYLGLANFSKRIADNDPWGDWRMADGAARAIDSSAEVDSTARLGSGVVVCEGVKIGARTILHPNVVVGPGCTIGADCVLFPGVVLYPKTQLGNRVRLHANVVLGSDGFGYARGPQGSVKIWHLGCVRIEDDVEIGAGTMVDRGTMKDTIIEHGAKLDNLCQIGHNGHVKAHAILCAQVGMAGNVTVGRGAILAGKVGVADKIEIGDGALVGPMSGLSKDVKAGEQVMGQQPAKPRREWWRLIVLFERLPELYDRLKKLEAKVEGK